MECHGCRLNHLDAKSFLRCCLCSGKYHFECLRLEESQFKALTTDYLSSWTCPSCVNVSRRTRSDQNTPVRQSLVPLVDESLDMSCDFSATDTLPPNKQVQQAAKTNINDNRLTLNKISELFDRKLNSALNVHMNAALH